MCGISGLIDFKKRSSRNILQDMNNIVSYRGPDDEGTLFEENEFCNIGFAHRRLSILDLSANGHQPMHYNNFFIVYNGEVYNYREIRKELISAGHIFSSDSDTEVILHAFEEWGMTCVDKFIGMFAFALFDKKNDKIYLVRDRAGVKPLYYYWKDGLFLFASELKSMTRHPLFNKKIDIDSVYQYIDFGYIPAPKSIFQNTHKIKPGHYIILDIKEAKFDFFQYWDVSNYYRLPKLNIEYKEAKEQLKTILHSAYEYRMVADVPVGVFLSGGYDSTSVAAILQKERGANKIKTFTIGFDSGNNEAPFAKEIAKFLGTDHSEYYCSTKEAQDIIPQLPFIYDEPFADSSAIPTILVSKYARKSVTVSLSADGGDEVFAGYSIYSLFLKRLSQIQKVPKGLRKVTGVMSGLASRSLSKPFPRLSHKFNVIHRVFSSEQGTTSSEVFKNFFLLDNIYKKSLFTESIQYMPTEFDADYSGFGDAISMAQAIDYKMYMCDDILTKVDRATMSVSLEGREPLLDHRIIEFVAQLPSKYKLASTQKLILKDIVHDYIPKSMMDRPKSGFSVPLKDWLQGDLKYLLDDFLSDSEVKSSGLFNPEFVSKIKKDFIEDKLVDVSLIWKLIQFQMWYKTWMV